MAPLSGHKYQVHRIPDERIPQIELMPVLARRNAMHGFFEVDVTIARQRLREHGERTGERLSFTAFLVACLARAVDENPGVQAFRRGRRLIVFDQVDVATLVEVEAEGARVPIPHVVRDAGSKTLGAIHREIRAVQKDGTLLTKARGQIRPMRWVPKPLRWLLWQALARSPRARKHYGGTVVVTSVGTSGAGRGWGVGLVAYPVTLTVGGISSQPVVRDGEIDDREHLCLTISLDHEVIDGAPAVRFGRRLRQLIEQGYGLEVPEDGHGPGQTLSPEQAGTG
jgi:pyruvate/2-oxoglutarate dehydrogenase complex dihydrolipoamide acyltransferase (E2) component